MDDDHTKVGKKAFPTEPYDGNRMNYENYDMDKLAWSIRKKHDEYLEAPDPRTIPRVETAYTIDTENDPHGPVGTRVRAENEGAYANRISRDFKTGKSIWSEAFTGTSASARESAMKAHQEQPFDVRHMFKTIKKDFGDKTDKQSGSLVVESISKRKLDGQTINSFNNEWNENKRMLTANGMNLPEPYIINLYLASLGPKYSTLRTVADVLPSEKRTLSHLMQLAVDHREDEDNDEATADSHALQAISTLKRQGYHVIGPRNAKRQQTGTAFQSQTEEPNRNYQHQHQSRPRCTVCGQPWHKAATCFKQGGGLSHLTREQRGTWLEANRRAKEQGNPPPGIPSDKRSALAAAVVTDHKNKQLDQLRKLISDSGIHIDGQEALLSTEWKPNGE